LYFLKNQTLCHLKYSQDASNKNIYPVRRADRRAILDYLRGLKADSVSIQKSGIKLPDPYKVTAATSHVMANKSNASNKIEINAAEEMNIEGEIKIEFEIKNEMTDESWDMDAHVIASSDSPIDVDSIDSCVEQGDSYKLVSDTDVGLSDVGEFELPIPVPAQKPMNYGLEVADAVDKKRAQKDTKQKAKEKSKNGDTGEAEGKAAPAEVLAEAAITDGQPKINVYVTHTEEWGVSRTLLISTTRYVRNRRLRSETAAWLGIEDTTRVYLEDGKSQLRPNRQHYRNAGTTKNHYLTCGIKRV